MHNTNQLNDIIEQRHRTQGYIAFIKKLGRDSHGFLPGTSAIGHFQAGFDEAEGQYASWQKTRVELGQRGLP